MKTIHATLLAHQQLEVTTTCLLVKVECVGAFEGSEYGFTNLDQDATYNDGDGALLYRHDNGFTPARLQATSGVNVDNSEIDGAVSDDGITEAMVRAGLFRGAKVTVYRVNYEDKTSAAAAPLVLTSSRHEVVAYGRAGETTYTEMGWRTEFRSLSQLLKQPIGQVTSRTCREQFGSVKCGKSFSWTSGTVTSVGTENDREFSDSTATEPTGTYKFGVIRWLTGDNAGHEMEVDAHTGDSSGATFTLALGLPYPIQPADTYERREDCSKIHDDGDHGCLHHWGADWIYQFRGSPFIPVDGTAMVPGAEIKRA